MVEKAKGERTKERIVDEAVKLVHKKGFENTTLANVAEAAGVRKGNFYYYFKTKEELGRAIVETHRGLVGEYILLWQGTASTPKERIKGYIKYLSANKRDFTENGCSVGGLARELAKLDSTLLLEESVCIEKILGWMETQYVEMGYGETGRREALFLLSAAQGAIALANALKDESIIEEQVKTLLEVVEGM